MAYSAITNAEIDQDSPITQTLMTKYRDNIISTRTFIATDDISNAATSEFDAFDATKFDAYLFILSNVIPASDASLYLRTSSDGGSTYDSGASDYVYRDTGAEVTSSRLQLATLGSAAGEDGYSGTLWIYGPHLAKKTQVTAQGFYETNAGTFINSSFGGQRQAQEAVNAVQFSMSTGNIESGTITMYGLSNN